MRGRFELRSFRRRPDSECSSGSPNRGGGAQKAGIFEPSSRFEDERGLTSLRKLEADLWQRGVFFHEGRPITRYLSKIADPYRATGARHPDVTRRVIATSGKGPKSFLALARAHPRSAQHHALRYRHDEPRNTSRSATTWAPHFAYRVMSPSLVLGRTVCTMPPISSRAASILLEATRSSHSRSDYERSGTTAKCTPKVKAPSIGRLTGNQSLRALPHIGLSANIDLPTREAAPRNGAGESVFTAPNSFISTARRSRVKRSNMQLIAK